MKLNCKQGDLAIVVRSKCGNEGKIVRCLELLVTDTIVDTTGRTCQYLDRKPHAFWRIDRPLNFGNPYASPPDFVQVYYSRDVCLRPLRGDLVDDETHTTQEKEVESC